MFVCTFVQYIMWQQTLNGFQPLFKKNGILSFLRCDDHSAWQRAPVLLQRKCASRLCSRTSYIFIYYTVILHQTLNMLRKLVVGSNYEEVACALVSICVCVCVCLCLHILPFPNLKRKKKSSRSPLKSQIFTCFIQKAMEILSFYKQELVIDHMHLRDRLPIFTLKFV